MGFVPVRRYKSLINFLLLGICRTFAFHARNRYQGRYDLPSLMEINGNLKSLVFTSPKTKELTVDWGNDQSVYELNKSILMKDYGVSSAYSLGPALGSYLIPPVPSRADIIHHCADLLQEEPPLHSQTRNDQQAISKSQVNCLDIGCGASAIFSLLAAAEYGWNVVGSDVSKSALKIAANNVKSSKYASLIELRHQHTTTNMFRGVVKPGEYYHMTVCNPPFYASKQAADAASRRKIDNLGLKNKRNFGGSNEELWCEGGELAFVGNMMKESYEYRSQLGWITSLISDFDNVLKLEKVLDNISKSAAMSTPTTRTPIPKGKEVIELSTGNKRARILAWKWI